MTPAELWELRSVSIANAISGFGNLLAIYFAYLATAYFVGRRLSRFQVAVVSFLFVFGAGITAFVVHVESQRTIHFLAQLVARHDEQSLVGYPALFVWSLACLMGITIAACLTFMYQIRRTPKLGAASS
jgi:hypothetical protein